MKRWLERLRSRVVVFLHDLLMIPAAWLLAYWLRFDLGHIPSGFIQDALGVLPLVVVVLATAYWRFGLYRGVWRFASVTDLIRISKAILAGTAILMVLLQLLDRLPAIPFAVPILFAILQFLLLAGPRMLYRLLKDRHFDWLEASKRVLIVGAGHAGEQLVRDMQRGPQRTYIPVAFVDDRLRRQGGDVRGVPIRGMTSDLAALVAELNIDLIMLAVPSASASEMQRLVGLCEGSGCTFRTVPQLTALMSGQVTVSQVRPVSIEDLLGRNPVTLNWDLIRGGLEGRTILVTGAGGSIGSELCRQLMTCNAASLAIVDNCEHGLYQTEMDLIDSQCPVPFSRHLVDVTNPAAIGALFDVVRPDIVFHAAAYKHVPLLEDQICAAVTNNVLGTAVVAEAADAQGCERFVLISTDKAVNPSNVMGATKRLAELFCLDLDRRSQCRFVAVRFGNVLGSAGSVVPRFQRQIERGGPVTVTHPEIERFFMTIPEACQLIMQAAAIGHGGEVLVLKMGDPVKIRYLAEQMIRLSGAEPGKDIEINYIGLRPGEKLYEELFYGNEALCDTQHPQIHVVSSPTAIPPERMAKILADLRQGVLVLDEKALVATLREALTQWRRSASGRDWTRIDKLETEPQRHRLAAAGRG